MNSEFENAQEVRNALDARLVRADIELQFMAYLIRADQDHRMLMLEDARTTFFTHNGMRTLFGWLSELALQGLDVSEAGMFNAITARAKQGEYEFLSSTLKQIMSVYVELSGKEMLEILRSAFQQRIINNNIFQLAYRQFLDNEPMEKVTDTITNAMMQLETGKQGMSVKTAATNVVERALNPDKNIPGLMTGLKAWDMQFGGFKRDRVYTFGGSPGSGKTMFCIDLICRLCRRYGPENPMTIKANHTRIQFFSLEMSEERVVTRLITNVAQLTEHQLTNQGAKYDNGELIVKPLTDAERDRLLDAYKEVTSWPLDIEYLTLNSKKLKSKGKMHSLKYRDKHVVKILDHLGEVEKGSFDTRREVDSIMDVMKSFARDNKDTAIVLSQLTKEAEKGEAQKKVFYRPNKGLLMESVGIEAKSDVVCMTWRPFRHFMAIDYDGMKGWSTKGKLILINEKNRDGKAGNDILLGCDERFNELRDYHLLY